MRKALHAPKSDSTTSAPEEPPAPTAEGSELAVPSKRDRLAKATIALGLAGITGMHAYILSMPAPFDVYSWNMSFGLSAIYLFYYANFGFDHVGATNMNRGLVAFLVGEFALCW